MIKTLIIDLDNCIFDTRSMGFELMKPVIFAMRKFNKDNFLNPVIERGINKDLWSLSLEDVFKKYDIPEYIVKSIRNAYENLEAPDCSKCYSDYLLLERFTQHKILVTTGYNKLQHSKIKKTGIKKLFNEIIVDSIDDPKKIKGKKLIFQELLKEYNWQPHEVMVIGDNAFSELKAGKELGMVTVQTLRPHVYRVEGFDHYVNSLKEVAKLLI